MQTYSILLVSDNSILADLLAGQFHAHSEMSFTHIICADIALLSKKEGLKKDTPPKIDAILWDGTDINTAIAALVNNAAIAAGVNIAIIDEEDQHDDAASFDDRIVRPIRFGILLARLRLALRRAASKARDEGSYKIGAYDFHPHIKTLEKESGEKIKLTEKEVDILQFLLAAQETHEDGVVSRAVLLNEVWGYQEGISTHTLETHIYRLRLKIGAELLMTQAGGYRLNV